MSMSFCVFECMPTSLYRYMHSSINHKREKREGKKSLKKDEIKGKYEKIKINDFISHRPLINALFGGTVRSLIMPSMWRFPFIHTLMISLKIL